MSVNNVIRILQSVLHPTDRGTYVTRFQADSIVAKLCEQESELLQLRGDYDTRGHLIEQQDRYNETLEARLKAAEELANYAIDDGSCPDWARQLAEAYRDAGKEVKG